MSERGYIAVDRGIFDHPSFAREPFTELQAWLWMLTEAAWKPMLRRVGRRVFTLKRGQLVAATRFLAEKWMWSESRVRRRIRELTRDAMVTTLATRDATIITICNYDKYQSSRRTDDAPTDAQVDAQTDAPTDAKRKKEPVTSNQKELSGAVADATRPSDAGKIFDEQFWSAYPRREGANPKAPARKAFITAVKNGNSPDAIVSGALRYAADLAKSNKIGTSYVAQALTWLHQRRWEDYPNEVVADAGAPKPPDPRLPSHEELQRKYGASHATDQGSSAEGVGIRPEGHGVRREARSECAQQSANDQTGDGGVEGMGTLFRGIPGLLSVGDEARDRSASGRENGCGDDGPDAVAGMVRH